MKNIRRYGELKDLKTELARFESEFFAAEDSKIRFSFSGDGIDDPSQELEQFINAYLGSCAFFDALNARVDAECAAIEAAAVREAQDLVDSSQKRAKKLPAKSSKSR